MTSPNHPPHTSYSPDALAVSLLQHSTNPETIAALQTLQQANAAAWSAHFLTTEVTLATDPVSELAVVTTVPSAETGITPASPAQAIGYTAIQAA